MFMEEPLWQFKINKKMFDQIIYSNINSTQSRPTVCET